MNANRFCREYSNFKRRDLKSSKFLITKPITSENFIKFWVLLQKCSNFWNNKMAENKRRKFKERYTLKICYSKQLVSFFSKNSNGTNTLNLKIKQICERIRINICYGNEIPRHRHVALQKFIKFLVWITKEIWSLRRSKVYDIPKKHDNITSIHDLVL